MKKYFLILALFWVSAFIAPKAHAQYTYFPPIYSQSSTLHLNLETARTRKRADSLRRSHLKRKPRLVRRSHRSRRTRSASRSRR